jgi:hypothetical protein
MYVAAMTNEKVIGVGFRHNGFKMVLGRAGVERMPKAWGETARLHPTKEMSAMAWIEYTDHNKILAGQATGLKTLDSARRRSVE